MARREVKRQMGVALSDDLREQLERAADVAGHSIAEEIRVRLAHSFQQEAIDPVTRELIEGIVNLAESNRVDMGAAWHASSGAHAAFSAAVAQRLRDYKPGPTPVTEKEQFARNLYGANTDGLFVPDDAAEMIGKTHERFDQRTHSYEYLRKAQEAKEARTLQAFGFKKEGKDKP
jgi:hypothetical protein